MTRVIEMNIHPQKKKKKKKKKKNGSKQIYNDDKSYRNEYTSKKKNM